MLSPESLPFRRAIITILALVSLILPTLHFHPSDEHSHEGDMAHSHGVFHADFFAVLDHDHSDDRRGHNGRVTDIEPPWSTDQINLVTLTSHNTKPVPLAALSVFLFYEEETNRSQSLFKEGFIKRDHPPPLTEAYTSLGSSRSPPRSA